MSDQVTSPSDLPDNYKWIALSNTTLGILMTTVNSSIILIALPDIFRGIKLNPLAPGNTSYLLWMLMGFMVCTAVLLVSFGRIGDMFGRVKMFTLGFAIFTTFSILLSLTWLNGPKGALWLILMRVGQGVGGACLLANSAPILTDAFPQNRRGLALGIKQRGRDRWRVHRPHPRWRPRTRRMASRLPRLGAVRSLRDGVGSPQAPGTGRAACHDDRLVGQCHVRHRARSAAGRHHLRHRALRRPHDGVDESESARGG